MELTEAVAWLEDHQNLEAMIHGRTAAPTLERMQMLTGLMAEPQRQYPVIHITGTNGKTSTARIVTELLVAMGLSVGTYTSPHLQVLNERIAWNGVPLSDEQLAAALSAVADLEVLLPPDVHLNYFEIMTGAAFAFFADAPVDVAVLEVGLGGTWDATNVADAQVAVVTGVGLDHTELLGSTRVEIAGEKAGIVKPGSTLVLGETDPDVAAVFFAAGAAEVWQRDREYSCVTNEVAVGGRLITVVSPGGRYEEVYVPLHGRHQGENAACALVAAEAFFGRPLPEDVVTEAMHRVRSPGRLEVVGRDPLVLLDGAHNVAGARALAATVSEEFGDERGRVLVVGFLRGREPTEMLEAMEASRARLVIACQADSPRAVASTEIVDAATALGIRAEDGGGVAEALAHAMEELDEGDMILVTGSLYVVGEARDLFSGAV